MKRLSLPIRFISGTLMIALSVMSFSFSYLHNVSRTQAEPMWPDTTGDCLTQHGGNTALCPDDISVKPNAPTLNSATAVSTTEITLGWTLNSSNQTSIIVEKSSDSTTWTNVKTLTPTTVGTTVDGLTKSTKYYFHVIASNAKGSATSGVKDATTLGSYTQVSQYQGEWVTKKLLSFQVYDSSKNLKATLAVGPSAWEANYCIDGTVTDSPSASFDGCSSDTTSRITEEWTVSKWNNPNNNYSTVSLADMKNTMTDLTNANNVFSSLFKITANDQVPYDDSAATAKRTHVEVGSCEGNGYLQRSGMYGIAFTEASGCKANNDGWWNFSVIPTKWHVTGTISR